MQESSGSEDSGPAAFPSRNAAPRQAAINAPPVVVGTALILIFAYVALRFLPPPAAAALEWSGAVSPARFLDGAARPAQAPAAMLTLATHMLLHSGLAHIALNCVWLLAFGAPVARRLGEDRAGAAAFAVLLIASGVAGALAFIAFHAASTTLLVGASGGVSGLLGGLVRFAFRRPGDGVTPDGLAPLASRPVIAWSAAVIILNAAVGVFGGLFGLGDLEIAWEAHVGGYLFGLLAFPAIARAAGRDAPRI
jgi:membrane associated rhomboid family serine protease